jgi:hypothetical protein
LSRRSRALALAGLSLTLAAATGCAHAGVTVRTPEADNTDLPANGIVHFVFPHVTADAPAVVVYPEVDHK